MRSCWRALLLAVCAGLGASCGPDPSELLRCDDLLPPAEASFESVAALVVSPGAKGCSGCHNTESPVWGYNFEAPGVAYTALSTRMGRIYPELAAGTMPKEGSPWSEQELRLLRSWYCYGAQAQDR